MRYFAGTISATDQLIAELSALEAAEQELNAAAKTPDAPKCG